MINLRELTKLLDDLTMDNYSTLVEELCYINPRDINGELIKCPSIFAHWNGALATVKRDRDTQELKVNTFIAESRKQCKGVNLNNKLTAKDLDDMVMSLPEYKHSNEDFIKKCEKHDMIKSLIEALYQKKDMLIQLSANQRAEIGLNK